MCLYGQLSHLFDKQRLILKGVVCAKQSIRNLKSIAHRAFGKLCCKHLT